MKRKPLTLADHVEILALITSLRALGKPLHLDTYCCQGGASKGYADAGFTVLGVDIDDQTHYPFAFVQGDAVEFIRRYGYLFDSISGSPPCQLYSKTQRIQKNDHPDLIAPTRAAMEATGRPFVIENVMDAAPELRDPVTLCGAMFGLETYRHRLFETGGGFTFVPPTHPEHVAKTTKMGRRPVPGSSCTSSATSPTLTRVVRSCGCRGQRATASAKPFRRLYSQYIGIRLGWHLGYALEEWGPDPCLEAA